MADITNSKLTQSILERADELREENGCKYLSVELILLSALEHLENKNLAEYEEEGTRVQRSLQVFRKDTGVSGSELSDKLKNKGNSISGYILFQKVLFAAREKAKQENKAQLTADILLECAISDTAVSASPKQEPGGRAQAVPEPGRRQTEERKEAVPVPTEETAEKRQDVKPAPGTLSGLIADTKELQKKLNEKILGQAHAVASFVSGYFQSSLFAVTDSERVKPRATFLFAGPSGVGKTFLAEEAAKAIGSPFCRFDMSEYSMEPNVDQLTGTDKSYKNSSEGLLTGFVAKNPNCVILFDEIEKAHRSAINLFLQVLDAGVLRDNRTDVEVSFKDTILIFTTNAGRNLYDGDGTEKLSSIPRKVILSALRKDVNPATGEPFFPPAICSRFASGNVVMFNHLAACDLTGIIQKRLEKHKDGLQEQLEIAVEMDDKIPSILLMAEGAAADGRTVISRADAFWGQELYELFRLVSSKNYGVEPGGIKKIRFAVDEEGSGEDIRKMMSPKDIPDVIALSDLKGSLETACGGICRFHYADDLDEAKKIYRNRSIQFIVCDAPAADGTDYLNREDMASSSRSFLLEILSFFKDVPVYVLEDVKKPLLDEEKISYIRRGVQGFLSGDGEDPKVLEQSLREVAGQTLQQLNLNELARANKVMTFETSQVLTEDRSAARIALFDFKLETAVDAGDSRNILSAVSRPDTRFADVIGAKEAKKELQYFVSYLKDTKRFMGLGVGVPKGIILYGPPGTGKTMLAKAMAGESGVTFIAAEGNQFRQKYVGEGEAAVHRLFALARKYAPSILFIDEIDTIAKPRTGSEFTAAAESVLTAFLAEMDGFSNDAGRPVFVLAATNFNAETGGPMSLDPALMRRFDRRIFVDLPDKEGRALFLESRLMKDPLFRVTEQGLKNVAERSTGMSIAQLVSVIELAKRDLIRDGKTFIDDAALEEALETFNNGERKDWSEEQTLRTARHEAGHALLNWIGGETPSYITIVSRGDHGGYMQHADQEGKLFYTRQDLLNRIRTALGGRAAEIVYYGREGGLSSGASGDLSQATAIAGRILGSYGMDDEFGMATFESARLQAGDLQTRLMNGINRILKEKMEEAIELIGRNRASIDALVEKLMSEDHLNGDEIKEIFQNTAADAGH